MTRNGDLVFPLIPARRGGSLDVAGRRSRRRGSGNEIASSRPYRRGDALRLVDWAASARLSTARGTDEFVVRESFAEDAVRIVVVVDRSRSMALYPDWLPWLDKQAAVREVGRMIVASGAAANALVGFASVGARTQQVVTARRDRAHARAIVQLLSTGETDGPSDSVDRALEALSRRVGTVLPGTFVFVVSDFLPPPSRPAARRRRGRLGPRPGRRPGHGLGALVPRRLRGHAAARAPRRPPARARPPEPQGGSRATRRQRTACRPPLRRAGRSRPRSGVDRKQRARGRARRVPRVGGRTARPGSRLSVSRADLVRLLAIGLVLGAAVAAVVVAVVVHRPGPSPRLLEDPVTVKRALSTSAALFGDPIQAEVDVYTNEHRVPAGSVRVRTDFRPYRVTATKVDRARQGGSSLLRTRISLECVTRACLLPQTGARVVQFPPIAVTYRHDGRQATAVIPWGPLQLSSRIPLDATAGAGIIDTAPPLEPQFARSPELLQTLLLGTAALLGLAGAALVVTALWPTSLWSRRRRLSPLERSLARVEAAARGDDEAERRRTLDELAARLGEVPPPSLEAQTRALAWGQSSPEPEALTRLAEQVRTTLNGAMRG